MPIISGDGYPDSYQEPGEMPAQCTRCAQYGCACERCEGCGELAAYLCDGVAVCLACDVQSDKDLPGEIAHDHQALPDGLTPTTIG